jgi:predicted RNA-binding protein YlxR (DUF448 family)
MTVRVVRGPGGELLPDLYGKLPGRGAHLCPDFACFEKATEKNSFSRSLRAPTRIEDPAKLFEVVLESSRNQIRAILSTAARSAWLIAGRTNVDNALRNKQVALLVLATDASASLVGEIVDKAKSGKVRCHSILTVSDLSRFHRGKPLAVLGIRHRGLARRLNTEIIKAFALTTSAEKTENRLATAGHGQLTVPAVRGKIRERNSGTSGARS